MPRPQVVDVRTLRWGCDLDEAWLSADERARAERFVFPEDRELWRRGRAWVRRTVAAYLGREPGSLEWDIDSRGRPSVRGAPPGFDVNWSHSGGWLALACTTGTHATRVGIDLEIHRLDWPVRETAPLVCTPEEAALLLSLPDPVLQAQWFFQLWTAKEALMKATGLGVALEPLTIAVAWSGEKALPCGYRSHPGWQLAPQENATASPPWTLAVAWR